MGSRVPCDGKIHTRSNGDKITIKVCLEVIKYKRTHRSAAAEPGFNIRLEYHVFIVVYCRLLSFGTGLVKFAAILREIYQKEK